MGIDIEKLEKRVNRVEGVLEDVLRERLLQIEMRLGRLEARLDTLYEKTERDKSELIERIVSLRTELIERMERDKTGLIERMERDKTELVERIERGLASLRVELIERMERDKTELVERMERDKRTIILWFIGVMLAFSTLNITALWAILSFAGK